MAAKAVNSTFRPDLVGRATIDAFRKLNPAALLRNPVIFVTEIVAAVVTVLFVRDVLAGNPLLDDEHSLDAKPWSGVTTATSLTDAWPPRIHELVKRYLGSPQLPAPMASWLLNCW